MARAGALGLAPNTVLGLADQEPPYPDVRASGARQPLQHVTHHLPRLRLKGPGRPDPTHQQLQRATTSPADPGRERGAGMKPRPSFGTAVLRWYWD